MRLGSKAAAAALAAAVCSGPANAINLILNGSFESPVVDVSFLPVSLVADHWTLWGPGPYVNFGSGDQNPGTGTFPNPESEGRFSNPDGNQLAYIFSNTGAATLGNPGQRFSQILTPVFESNRQYRLTAGVALAGATPPPDDRLQLALVHGNVATLSTLVYAASKIVQNNGSYGLNGTTLLDFSANSFILEDSSPLVGHPIQVLLQSIVRANGTPGVGGGQFVMDHVRVTSAAAGDANRDGFVDTADLTALASRWQMSGEWETGDFTLDGLVDIKDLRILSQNWPFSQSAFAALGLPPVSVPEPAMSGLLLIACQIGMLRRRRRAVLHA